MNEKLKELATKRLTWEEAHKKAKVIGFEPELKIIYIDLKAKEE